MICQHCNGLQMELGKAYAYAGRVCICHMAIHARPALPTLPVRTEPFLPPDDWRNLDN